LGSRGNGVSGDGTLDLICVSLSGVVWAHASVDLRTRGGRRCKNKRLAKGGARDAVLCRSAMHFGRTTLLLTRSRGTRKDGAGCRRRRVYVYWGKKGRRKQWDLKERKRRMWRPRDSSRTKCGRAGGGIVCVYISRRCADELTGPSPHSGGGGAAEVVGLGGAVQRACVSSRWSSSSSVGVVVG
jgi:hypothetical protein